MARVVPKHHHTGEKVQLGSISKRGNIQLQVLMIRGAHAALNQTKAEMANSTSGQNPLLYAAENINPQ